MAGQRAGIRQADLVLGGTDLLLGTLKDRWHDSCSSALALTKVDWNNNTLYKKLPVTLVYSQIFANVVKQAPDIVDDVYDCRFFM
jgi:hypothetical protein